MIPENLYLRSGTFVIHSAISSSDVKPAFAACPFICSCSRFRAYQGKSIFSEYRACLDRIAFSVQRKGCRFLMRQPLLFGYALYFVLSRLPPVQRLRCPRRPKVHPPQVPVSEPPLAVLPSGQPLWERQSCRRRYSRYLLLC